MRKLSTLLRFFDVRHGSCVVLPLAGPEALTDAFTNRYGLALAAQLRRVTLFRTHDATYHADAWSHALQGSSFWPPLRESFSLSQTFLILLNGAFPPSCRSVDACSL